MSLVTLDSLLQKAKKEKYAVGAFNATDLNTARGIIAAAEETNSPVILQFAEVHEEFVPLDTIAPIYLDLAQKAKVPVCVHLDHGENFETIIKAIHLGFTSVMVDASTKPIAENTQMTREIVKIAKALNVSVESELGRMNKEDGTNTLDYNDMADTYTDPHEAKQFTAATNISALAVAFGTVHGLYAKKPNLNFERLKEIRDNTTVPLVMHGGSGLSDEEYRQAILNGVTKINYYSTMSFDVTNGIRDFLNNKKDAYLYDLDLQTIDLVKKNLIAKIKVFGSENQA